MLNESTKLTETTVNEFAQAVITALKSDLNGNGQGQEAKFHLAVEELLSHEKCKGIFYGRDGDKNCLVDATALEKIILDFAESNPNSNLGKLRARTKEIFKNVGTAHKELDKGVFEAAVHFMCNDYFENYKSDMSMKMYRMNNQRRFN